VRTSAPTGEEEEEEEGGLKMVRLRGRGGDGVDVNGEGRRERRRLGRTRRGSRWALVWVWVGGVGRKGDEQDFTRLGESYLVGGVQVVGAEGWGTERG